MSVDDITQLTIIVSSATLTKPGFGTPLALVTDVPAGWGSNKVREFSKLSELTTLGFTSSDPAYVIASKIKSQSPAPTKFKIAKRDSARKPASSVKLKCLSATEGDVYSVEVGIGGGATTLVEYTVLSSATTTTVATAIELLIEAVTGVNSTSATDTITAVPVTAGKLVNVKNWNKFFEITDNAADEGVADDLDDILEEDTDWYGLLLDNNAKAEVEAAGAWVEANGKLFAYSTSDAGCKDTGSTTDVFYAMKALNYDRSFGIYNGNTLLAYSAAAWMGRGLAFDPGKITWAFKDLKGISVDKLSTGVQDALEAKNGNFYVTKYGRPITWEGKLSSGEFIDITHGLDWFDTEMRVAMFQAVSSLPKLPFTVAGLGVIEAAGRGVMRAAVKQGVFADDDNLTFVVPALSDIDEVTKAQRLCPDIEWSATLAGAIQKTKAQGLVKH